MADRPHVRTGGSQCGDSYAHSPTAAGHPRICAYIHAGTRMRGRMRMHAPTCAGAGLCICDSVRLHHRMHRLLCEERDDQRAPSTWIRSGQYHAHMHEQRHGQKSMHALVRASACMRSLAITHACVHARDFTQAYVRAQACACASTRKKGLQYEYLPAQAHARWSSLVQSFFDLPYFLRGLAHANQGMVRAPSVQRRTSLRRVLMMTNKH